MRIAIIQNNPVFKNVDENLSRLTTHIDKLSKTDLILLPEMATTGYCFDSKTEIDPFINSKTREWALDVASTRSTIVAIGVPTRQQDSFFNSLLVCFPNKTTTIYCKHFLYTQDEHWATPGEAFESIQIPGFGRVALGICMDINPHQFSAPFEAFEFANYHLDVDWIWLSNAWLSSEGKVDENPSVSTINYWITRLSPLIKSNKTCNVVIANRVGIEGSSVFCGSSCILKIGNGRFEVCAALGGADEGVIVADI